VTNLAKLKPGDKGKITSIGAIGPLKRRGKWGEMGSGGGNGVRLIDFLAEHFWSPRSATSAVRRLPLDP
jgi:hypothetical protein